jgi:hypothetical protein
MVVKRGCQHQFTKRFVSLKPIVTARHTIIDFLFCADDCLPGWLPITIDLRNTTLGDGKVKDIES